MTREARAAEVVSATAQALRAPATLGEEGGEGEGRYASPQSLARGRSSEEMMEGGGDSGGVGRLRSASPPASRVHPSPRQQQQQQQPPPSISAHGGAWQELYGGESGAAATAAAPSRSLPPPSGGDYSMLPSSRAAAEIAAHKRAASARTRAATTSVYDPHFTTNGPLVTAPTRLIVSSTARPVVEAREDAGLTGRSVVGGGEEGDDGENRWANTTRSNSGYLHAAHRSHVGGGKTIVLAPSQSSPRATSAEVFSNLGPAAAAYRDVFDDLPVMHEATAEVFARSHSIANPRVMGYADARPNVMPLARWGGVNPDNTGERSMFTASGSEGVANAKWAAGLRPALYTPSKYEDAARSHGWASPGMASAPLPPSATASGYAYKHAAASSQYLPGAGNVYDRLTDHRGYTGLHRHRFDGADGRGLGMRGRDDAGTDSAFYLCVCCRAARGYFFTFR